MAKKRRTSSSREVDRYRDSLKNKYSGKKNSIVVFLEGIALIALLVAGLFSFVIGIAPIDGESMSPTLANGQKVMFFRLIKDYQVGDVVSFKMPSGSYFVKRIIAKEGDTVALENGKVLVNGKEIREPYAVGKTKPQEDMVQYPFKVSKDCYFVIGDNREGSIDSRSFGEIVVYQIEGKILGDY